MTDAGKKPAPLVFCVVELPVCFLGLNDKENSVLVYLAKCYNPPRNGPDVWPSIPTIAARTGLSDSTVRRSLQSLQSMDLVKRRSDSGKANVYTINVGLVRDVHERWVAIGRPNVLPPDPCHRDRGQMADPRQPDRGTPFTLTGDPCHRDTRRYKELAKGKGQGVSSIDRSTELRVRDGDHQRKLAVHGLVTQATEQLRSPVQERSTGKTEDDGTPRRRAGKR